MESNPNRPFGCLWSKTRGCLSCHNRPKNTQHTLTLELLHFYQYVFKISKEVLLYQRVTKLQTIKAFKATCFEILCCELLLIGSPAFNPGPQFFRSLTKGWVLVLIVQGLIARLWKVLTHTDRHAKAQGWAYGFWVLYDI